MIKNWIAERFFKDYHKLTVIEAFQVYAARNMKRIDECSDIHPAMLGVPSTILSGREVSSVKGKSKPMKETKKMPKGKKSK